MAGLVQDNGTLRIKDLIDIGDICLKSAIDEGEICMKEPIDIDVLHTNFSNSLTPQVYRADTTKISADSTIFTCDYYNG